MQLTKYLLEVEMVDGSAVVLDFMSIQSYTALADKSGVAVTMTDGATINIDITMEEMKIAAGSIGVPFFSMRLRKHGEV